MNIFEFEKTGNFCFLQCNKVPPPLLLPGPPPIREILYKLQLRLLPELHEGTTHPRFWCNQACPNVAMQVYAQGSRMKANASNNEGMNRENLLESNETKADKKYISALKNFSGRKRGPPREGLKGGRHVGVRGWSPPDAGEMFKNV